MSLEEIERRLGVLEDIQEIKRLKARYCVFCDNSYDADGLASLFAENGVMDDGWRGGAKGREDIRNFFIKAGPRVPFARHMVMNPMIEVAGDEAKGTWYLFEACTYLEGNRAVWGSARYDEEYARVDGEWKFKSIRLNAFFWAPFDLGWVKKGFA